MSKPNRHQKKRADNRNKKNNNSLNSRPRVRVIVTALSAVMLTVSIVPAHANIFDPLLKVLLPFYDGNKKNEQTNSNTLPENLPHNNAKNKQVNQSTNNSTSNIFSPNGNASDILNLSNNTLNSPNLYQLLDAEFAYDRGDIDKALSLYKQQSFNKNATAVFERALDLSLKYEDIQDSLTFAHKWHQQNPNHVPAWFYVAHLALQAHDYELAGDTLSRILQYDPKADFSQIVQGIYPTDTEDQRKLLVILQQLNSEQNATLSVLQAGLLLEFNQTDIALIHINRALKIQKNNIPFIILKADILQKLGQSEPLCTFLADARKNWLKNQQGLLNGSAIAEKSAMAEKDETYITGPYPVTDFDTTLDTDTNDKAKELYLYEIRYRLQQQSQDKDSTRKAWQLLIEANSQFDDPEITLLASLVSLDVQEYTTGDQLLITLLDRPAYQNQAYFYLATSAERQHNYSNAKQFYARVVQEDLILEARKKVVAYELLDGNIDKAIDTLIDLRNTYPQYATQSYLLQADILIQQGIIEQAEALLVTANKAYPKNAELQFARIKLLDNASDYRQKYEGFTKLRKADPDNVAYELAFAKLLLSKRETQQQGISIAQKVVNMPSSDENFDIELYWQGLNLLASTALDNKEYQQVIDYVQTPYQISPMLPTGILLLRAYQGTGDIDNFSQLQHDLQQQFGYIDAKSELTAEPKP